MPQRKKPRGACKSCGEPIPASKPSSQQFCHSRCKNRWWRECRVRDWLVECPEKYQREYIGRAVPPFMRAWLYERQRRETGRQAIECEQCRTPLPTDDAGEPTGDIVNHKNGRTWDNHPDNLEILCRRCERHDPHNGARNRGHGRQHDRDAYRPAAERAEIRRLTQWYHAEQTSLPLTARHRALLKVVYDTIKEENPALTVEQVGRLLETLYQPREPR